MSSEVTMNLSMQIRADSIEYRSLPTSFNIDMTGRMGPVPGAMLVTTAGTDVDLSQLTVPGVCRIQNQDTTNWVEAGVWDPEAGVFYPMLEIGPGQTFPLQLARNLQQEYGTGTGTTGANTNRLRLKADTAPCVVLVEAFEK